MLRKFCVTLLACLIFGPALQAGGSADAGFQKDVLPIFEKNCLQCHSGADPQGLLHLGTREAMLAGGKSGPALMLGDSDRSLLVSKLISGAMPPGDVNLSQEEIRAIRLWIDAQAAHTGGRLYTEKDVLPIFQMHCVNCHGKAKQEAGLDLRTRAGRLRGGESGPALVPGDPGRSLLFSRIISQEMPPLDKIRPPTTAEVEVLSQWILAGAAVDPPPADAVADPPLSPEDTEFWSFRSPRRPDLPRVRHPEQARNPIDLFLLARLEAKDLGFSPEAGPLVLLRRAYLDLTGMPPTSQEVLDYLADREPGAYGRLLDRLLDSPAYGERWAQYWLDVAGYSDSEGIIDEDKVRPHAWRYRDYVIRALNRDTPYDRFLTEQLAGDELVNYKQQKEVTRELVNVIAATGFLRLAPDGTYGQPNGSLQERMDVIADELQVLGSSVLGLTVGCARCHDHKYDPLSQREYYSLAAIFQTALDPYDWRPPTKRVLRVALEADLKEVEAHNAPLQVKLRNLETELEDKARPYKEKFQKQALAALPPDLQTDLRAIAETPEAKRSSLQRFLARKFKEVVDPTYPALGDEFPEFKESASQLQKDIAHIKNSKYGSETNFRDKTKYRTLPGIRALYDMGGDPSPVYRLNRGEAQSVAERVYPDVPRILSGTGLEPYRPKPSPGRDTSGNRLGLARWLTQEGHPLTSRVQVNRIWGHHFGRELVTTPGDFGKTGSQPTHPQLLDWLAAEFVDRGWSMKAMHRLIMTSAAYRQASRVSPRVRQQDPDNLLLSRMPLRRLEAEAIHDSVLRVTGRLDPTPFGIPVPLKEESSGEVVPESTSGGWRRAVYLLKRRRMPVSSLEAFDYPAMIPNCDQRRQSNVPLQALQLFNGELMRGHARYLAGRLMDQAPGDTPGQIEKLYLEVLSRYPTTEEDRRIEESLQRLQREWRGHLERKNDPAPRGPGARWSALSSVVLTLLNSAEFLYID